MKRTLLALILIVCTAPFACATVPSDASTIAGPYACDGSDTTFTFSFGLDDDDDLQVIKVTDATGAETVLTKTTHYTITGANGNDPTDLTSGGTVTTTTAYSSDYTIWLRRSTAKTQTTNIDDEDVEEALDKLTRIVQDLAFRLGLCLQIQPTETGDTVTFGVDGTAGYAYRDASGDWTTANPSNVDQTIATDWADILDGTTTTAANAISVAAQLGRPFINVVTDYGADNTGATDTTTELQAAIDAANAASSGPVFLPPGNYLLGSPLTVYNYTQLIGVPGRTTITVRDAGEAAIDVSGTSANVSYVHLEGIVFDADAAGCYAIKGPVASYYLAMWRMKSCIIRAELGYGWYGLAADCLWEDVRFGHQGTPGAIHQAVYLGGSNAKVQFSNTFRKCYFSQQVGCNAAVDVRLGHNLSFDACTFDLIDTRAIYARGATTIVMNACNFEAIEPADGNDVIFDIADDLEAQGYRTYLSVTGSRFSLTDGDTTALCYVDAVSLFILENSSLSMTNNYYTMRTGPVYDSRLVMRNNRVAGELSTALESWSTVLQQEILTATPWRLTAQSAAPGDPVTGDVYLDDGTNTSNLKSGLRSYSGTAWETLGQPVYRVITKTFDIDTSPSPATDYHFDNGAGVTNTTEQVITLTDVLPAYCELVSAKLRCYQTVTDNQSMTFDLGTTSGADEIWAAKAIDTTGDIGGTAAGEYPEIEATSAATTLYLGATPGRNWSTLPSGRWRLMLTVADYGALYSELTQ